MLERLRKMLSDHLAQAEAILARAADGETLSAVENEQLEKLHQAAENLKSQIAHYAAIEAARTESDALAGRLGDRRPETGRTDAPQTQMSLGKQFTSSEEFSNWGGRGQSGLFTSDTSLAVITTTDDGAMSNAQMVPGVVPRSRTPLFDAVAKIPVTSTSVEYEVFEKWVAGTVAEGAAKPEAGTFTMVNKPLEQWAHWKKLSRAYKADESYVAAVIEQQLIAGVRRKAEAACVAAVLGTNTAAAVGGGAGKFLEGLRQAIGKIDPDWGIATHVILHPEDYANADIQAFTNGHTGTLLGVGPWGLNVIASTAATKGTGVVFDIEALTCYLRTGIEVFMTDSDISGDGATAKSDFRHNVLTVLAEQRGLAVLQNAALAVPGKAA